MKLFSRKALVAGAAAVALSFAGTSVATAEETKTGGSSVSDLFGGLNRLEAATTNPNEGGRRRRWQRRRQAMSSQRRQ